MIRLAILLLAAYGGYNLYKAYLQPMQLPETLQIVAPRSP